MSNVKLQDFIVLEDFGTRRTFDELFTPRSHEERMEWVRKSYERFFEKIREIDNLVNRSELN